MLDQSVLNIKISSKKKENLYSDNNEGNKFICSQEKGELVHSK